MVTQMVAIGEESGALDSMLGKVADFFEAEVDDAVDALSSLMEPIIMVMLGTLLGEWLLPCTCRSLSWAQWFNGCGRQIGFRIQLLLALLVALSACWLVVSLTS